MLVFSIPWIIKIGKSWRLWYRYWQRLFVGWVDRRVRVELALAGRGAHQAHSHQGRHRRVRDQILQEQSFNFKLSGNKVYCTNAVLLLIKVMLCSKLHRQNFLSSNCFLIKFAPCEAPKSTASGKLIFDERVVVHRVVEAGPGRRCTSANFLAMKFTTQHDLY